MQYRSKISEMARKSGSLARAAVALPVLAVYALACSGSAEEVTPSPTGAQPTPTASASYSPTPDSNVTPTYKSCITDKTRLVLYPSIKTDNNGTKYVSFGERDFYVADDATNLFTSYADDVPVYLFQLWDGSNVIATYQFSVYETIIDDPGGMTKVPQTYGSLRFPLPKEADSLRILEPLEGGSVVYEGRTYRLMPIEYKDLESNELSLAPQVLCGQNR